MNFLTSLILISTTLAGFTAKSLYDIQKIEAELSTTRLEIIKLQADNLVLQKHNSIITDYIKINNETLGSINSVIHSTPDLIQSHNWLSVICFGAITGMILYIYLYGATGEQVDDIVVNHVNKLTTDIVKISDNSLEVISKNLIESTHFQESLALQIIQQQNDNIKDVIGNSAILNKQLIDMLEIIFDNVKSENSPVSTSLVQHLIENLATEKFVSVASTLT